MAGLARLQVQLGDSSTATNNFVLTSAAADGTMKLARGNNGATTQDVLNVNASGIVDVSQGLTIAGSAAQRMLLTASQNTSTGLPYYDFLGIPSWAKKITVMLYGVSLSATSRVMVQLGTSSGFEITGYTCTITGPLTSTAGFITLGSQATDARSGLMTLCLLSANTWLMAVATKSSTTDAPGVGAGDKVLPGVLDRVRITSTGADTFDAGSVSLLIEGY